MTYDHNLRKIAVNSYLSKFTSFKDTIKIFKISKSTLYNWINNPIPNENKRISKMTPNVKCFIREYIIKFPNFIMKNLIGLIFDKFNTILKKSIIYDTIKKLNIKKKKIYKKNCFLTDEKKNILIAKFKDKIKNIPHTNIISIDESSFDSHISHNLAWSTKGTKLAKINTRNKVRYTIISAVSNSKIINNQIILGSCNGTTFMKFIKDTIKKLSNKQKYYLLMDNARIHHYKLFKKYISKIKKCEIIYNVPYCPEFNPIERVFSKTKNIVKNNVITNDNLKLNIIDAFNKITSSDLNNYFLKSLKI